MIDTPRCANVHWYGVAGTATVEVTFAQKLEQELNAVTAEKNELRFLLAAATNTLRLYRNESPPGHQPHMICHVADEIIAKSEAALRRKDAEK